MTSTETDAAYCFLDTGTRSDGAVQSQSMYRWWSLYKSASVDAIHLVSFVTKVWMLQMGGTIGGEQENLVLRL